MSGYRRTRRHAKFAYPDRVAIALVGDGATQMLGINGLTTISKYWTRWSDPRLVVLVLHHNDLNQVNWEQRVMLATRNSKDPRIFPISSTPPTRSCWG